MSWLGTFPHCTARALEQEADLAAPHRTSQDWDKHMGTWYRDVVHKARTVEPVLKTSCVVRSAFQTSKNGFSHRNSPVLRDFFLSLEWCTGWSMVSFLVTVLIWLQEQEVKRTLEISNRPLRGFTYATIWDFKGVSSNNM